ncbi:hypothetical protein O181_005636 [Austropuccinia psidii MF-1]|uniref:Uncharacterized protein n=1 Tax=Austropuccinia psidii MF-1 TaxID=1389203 RepID=A0A9Q3BJ86_9BASI|nr:hypothetical protein [Austropuccinia psidii MF-1]
MIGVLGRNLIPTSRDRPSHAQVGSLIHIGNSAAWSSQLQNHHTYHSSALKVLLLHSRQNFSNHTSSGLHLNSIYFQVRKLALPNRPSFKVLKKSLIQLEQAGLALQVGKLTHSLLSKNSIELSRQRRFFNRWTLEPNVHKELENIQKSIQNNNNSVNQLELDELSVFHLLEIKALVTQSFKINEKSKPSLYLKNSSYLQSQTSQLPKILYNSSTHSPFPVEKFKPSKSHHNPTKFLKNHLQLLTTTTEFTCKFSCLKNNLSSPIPFPSNLILKQTMSTNQNKLQKRARSLTLDSSQDLAQFDLEPQQSITTSHHHTSPKIQNKLEIKLSNYSRKKPNKNDFEHQLIDIQLINPREEFNHNYSVTDLNSTSSENSQEWFRNNNKTTFTTLENEISFKESSFQNLINLACLPRFHNEIQLQTSPCDKFLSSGYPQSISPTHPEQILQKSFHESHVSKLDKNLSKDSLKNDKLVHNNNEYLTYPERSSCLLKQLDFRSLIQMLDKLVNLESPSKFISNSLQEFSLKSREIEILTRLEKFINEKITSIHSLENENELLKSKNILLEKKICSKEPIQKESFFDQKFFFKNCLTLLDCQLEKIKPILEISYQTLDHDSFDVTYDNYGIVKETLNDSLYISNQHQPSMVSLLALLDVDSKKLKPNQEVIFDKELSLLYQKLLKLKENHQILRSKFEFILSESNQNLAKISCFKKTVLDLQSEWSNNFQMLCSNSQLDDQLSFEKLSQFYRNANLQIFKALTETNPLDIQKEKITNSSAQQFSSMTAGNFEQYQSLEGMSQLRSINKKLREALEEAKLKSDKAIIEGDGTKSLQRALSICDEWKKNAIKFISSLQINPFD